MPRTVYVQLALGALGVGVGIVSCATATSPLDPVRLSPQYYTVPVDTNRVRVLEYRLAPGQREVMHTHPDYVVYFFQDAMLRVTYPDGRTSETSVTRGEVLYREALSHAIENIGGTEIRALLIELKPGAR